MKALKKGIRNTLLDRTSEPQKTVGERESASQLRSAQPGPSFQHVPSFQSGSSVQSAEDEDEFFDTDEPEARLPHSQGCMCTGGSQSE